jgi:hypothetical protein
MAYQIPYAGQVKWVPERTILFTLFGSRAYGTDTPTSDWDYRGVCVPPRRYRDGFLHRFEQATDLGADADGTIYAISKFMDLAADCNPSILEVLFVDDEALLLCHPLGQVLRDRRMEFLSRKALYTFRGYAVQQLRRIETHRKWLLDPPDHRPTRAEFGLQDQVVIPSDQLAAAMSVIQKRVDSWEIDFGTLDDAEKIHIQEQMYRFLTEVQIGADERFMSAARLLGYNENFVHLIAKEKLFRNAVKHWEQFLEWKKNRNEKRAALEAHHGYDTKHGMHLVRLMRMCREILTEGKVLVRRPDAKELLAIREGAWSYERLIEWAKQEDIDLVEVARKSPLPNHPNRNALDELCQELTRSFVG